MTCSVANETSSNVVQSDIVIESGFSEVHLGPQIPSPSPASLEVRPSQEDEDLRVHVERSAESLVETLSSGEPPRNDVEVIVQQPGRQSVESDSDGRVCWICLCEEEESSRLVTPCRCPRLVHLACLNHWQRVNMGTSREKLCEFCSQALPDWRDSISSAQYMQIVLKRFWEQTLYFLVPFFLLLLVCTLGLFLYYLGRETFSPSASCQPKGKNCTSVFLFFMFGLVLGIVVGVLGLSTLIIIRMVRRMRAARNGVQPADPVQEPPEPIEIADPPADPVQEP
eukprot:CAMPEP_0196659588 /NCGR_PEP_ID=MMETSP1086-20130531/35722_1 /TAXON_ID=77921 /ORGANISM="Cyanoptyche  gloeocystis , Strain SAG4.97" /LENGTH=281 /DNA_ID=CAMNT_0041993625 /DNA_START=65 /DNA_END=906 /DNA_ORIENTATION=+